MRMPRPAPPRMPSVRDASAWFEASTARGPITLCVFAGLVRHAIDAVLALDRCEPLLEALHEWTGLPLDWRWREAPALGAAPGGQAVATWQPEPSTAQAPEDAFGLLAMLALPWRLMRSLPPAPERLARRLAWCAVPGVVVLARLALDPGEAALLEPGGAVLVPDSMRPGWRGRLHAEGDAGPGVPLALDAPWAPRLLRVAPDLDEVAGWRPAEAPDRDGRLACELRAATALALPVDRYAGWFDDAPIGELASEAALWRLEGAGEPARILARGPLMPWGDGWAMAVARVE